MQICIAACRANANMSQTEFAKAIGVTLPTICNWEKGKSEPNLSQLRQISELSGIPMDYIVMTPNS